MIDKYNANLTWEPYLWYEMKVVAGMLASWLSESSIKDEIIDNNLFQYKTLKSVPKRLSCIKRRLKWLDSYLLDKLSGWSGEESSIISLFAIYQDSVLVRDFIDEFIQERYNLKQYMINDWDIMSYFNSKSREHIEINNWSENTLKKIRQILKNILSGAWFINNKELQIVIINHELKKYLIKHWNNKFIFALWL